MQFDIIDITQDEVDELPAVRQKLIRTAQQKKNELEHKLEQQLQAYYCLCNTNNMYLSSLYNDKKAELEAEVDYQVEILREQLLFNLELGEPTHDGETGGSGSDDSGYIVDYELARHTAAPRFSRRFCGRALQAAPRGAIKAFVPVFLLYFCARIFYNG